MSDLVTLIDITGCNTYIGQAVSEVGLAQSSTVWKIMRVQDNTSGCTVIYADGNATFTKRWTNRTSFTYSVT